MIITHRSTGLETMDDGYAQFGEEGIVAAGAFGGSSRGAEDIAIDLLLVIEFLIFQILVAEPHGYTQGASRQLQNIHRDIAIEDMHLGVTRMQPIVTHIIHRFWRR